MALPADVSTRQVHGAWIGMDGNPRSGSVTFTPTAEKLVNIGSSTIIIGTVTTAHLDASGEATATLPCTDDPDLGGGPFSYLVTVSLVGDEPYAFWIDLPEDPSVLELAAVTPILPASGGSTVVTSVNGLTGAVTLSPADIGAEVAGTAVTAIAGHVLAADPHGDRAYAVQRANHTGTQTSATISDFATAVASTALAKTSNLSDLSNATTARTNLGLGDSATRAVGTASGTVAAGDDSRITGAAQKASNLSDLASASTARTNLGLGDSATRNVGTTAGTVCAGDDARLSGGGGGGVPTTRLITAGTGLTGGGDLSADRTLAVSFGTTAGTVAAGNDARFSPNPPRCSLTRIADLALTAATVTAVPIATSVYQEGGTWWTTGSTITVPAGASGLYIIAARAIFKDAAPNTGERSVWVRRQTGGALVDDPPVAAMTTSGTGTAIWPDVSVANVAPLVAGQVYYVSVRTGIALTLYGVEVTFTRLPVP